MKRLLMAAAAVLALAGCGTSQAAAHPSTLTVHGTLHVMDTCAAMSDDYPDIVSGTQITVTGPTGKTLAVGPLGDGTDGDSGSCLFPFTVHGVPARFAEYGVAVSHRGVVDFSRADLGQADLVLGNS